MEDGHLNHIKDIHEVQDSCQLEGCGRKCSFDVLQFPELIYNSNILLVVGADHK